MRGGAGVRAGQTSAGISTILATREGKSARRVGTGLSDPQCPEAVRDSVKPIGQPNRAWAYDFRSNLLRQGFCNDIGGSDTWDAGSNRKFVLRERCGSKSGHTAIGQFDFRAIYR